MFNKSTGGNIKGSKLIHSDKNTTYNEYNFHMGAPGREDDIISNVQAIVACVCKNQSTDADGSGLPQADHTTQVEGYVVDDTDNDHTIQLEGYAVDDTDNDHTTQLEGLVNVCDMVPASPSAFPVASIADRYTRCMLELLVGYPLYEPKPFHSQHSSKYLCNGVNIGDVGFVREDGSFDFLFNICPPQDDSINPPNLPNGFSLETPEHSETRETAPLSRGICFVPSTVTETKSGKYICNGPEGAVLVLPEGAIQYEVINKGRFEELAKRHGVEWYEYTKALGRGISNGSLYLVTSVTKCTQQWGIAVFHRSCDPGQGLSFSRKLRFPCWISTPKYRWKGSSACITKVANPGPNQKDAPNQCVFLRGYKITIRQDIFDKLHQPPKTDTAMFSSSPQAGLKQQRQPATRMRGGGSGGGTDLMSILTRTRTKTPTVTQSDAVVLHADFNSSPIHPSDLVNAALLSQNPKATVALTHDDVWCDLLRDNFPKLNPIRLASITRSYASRVDEYGCVSLEKFLDPINDENSISSPALQGPIQEKLPTVNEEYTIENNVPSVQEKNGSVGHVIFYEVHGDTVIFQFGDGHYTEQERVMIRDFLSNITAFTLRDVNDIMSTMKSHFLTLPILNLPNPQAAYGDDQIKTKQRLCVKGTRVPLLQEMADWISGTDDTRIYVLSGPAEIGKSTIAYTIAARADTLGLLGASFFFSRDGAGRDNGKLFFIAIAYQLCLYNELFAKAIDAALLAKPLSDATMEDPLEQFETLILEPLSNVVRSRTRPILIIVDALDECDEEDVFSLLTGLHQLVQDLPSFKVILTTRPRSHFDSFFHHKIFHLQDIKDKIHNDTQSCHERSLSQELQDHVEGGHASDIEYRAIDDDAQPYLQHSPSQEVAGEQLQDRAEGVPTSNIEIKIIDDEPRSYLQPNPSQEVAREQLQDRAEGVPTSDIGNKVIDNEPRSYPQPNPSQEVTREQLQDRAEGVPTSDIENRVIEDDTRPYLQPNPSQEVAREQLQDRAEGMLASDIENRVSDNNTRPSFQPNPSQEVAGEQLCGPAECGHTHEIEDKIVSDDTRSYLQRSPSQEVARKQSVECGHNSDIEDKVINDDTQPYLQPSPSQQLARKQAESGSASGTWIDSIVGVIEKHIPRMNVSIPFSENFNTGNLDEAEDAVDLEDPNLSIPAVAPPVTTESHAVDHGDGEKIPSISPFQELLNVEINSIRFGDGQFTDVQRDLIGDYIANLAVLLDTNDNLKKHLLTQSIISLPREEAEFNTFQIRKNGGPCLTGTRVAILREMADRATGLDEPRMQILSGLAGIGKSTIAYTIASRAADLNLLGASFFFSRDKADRKDAELFFSTIAYQLCVYNETFAKAIGDVLLTERGFTATTRAPQEQLQILILDPLRSIVQSRARPILIVVDALDECDECDVISVLTGLSQLVRDLPPFRVILSTCLQPHLDFFARQDGHEIFHLQDIEDKDVDGDIRLYLQYNLSLKAVKERYPQQQWCVSDEDIDFLVRAAGRLFIIASTGVRYIFDKSASNPAAQIQKLLRASAHDQAPFKDLNHFYTAILRNVVCDDDIVSRYKSVVGTIILVQHPLPVSTLAHLINMDVNYIYAVLDKLQSVILLESDDVPRIYHSSFSDYLMDEARCKDPLLRIDTRIHHTQIAIRCFEIMDSYLKRNILGLGDPAQFMSNQEGLKEDGIMEEQLQEKIPHQLRYVCIYWVNHLEVANMEDKGLMNRLEKFAHEHMLYWLEVLSLIGKLDSAHHAIGVVLKLLTSTSSHLHRLLSDALRFIANFYEIIKRSALHTYHSAMPFTSTDSLLYRRYIKDAEHSICSIEGGPEKWGALVANLSHGEHVDVIKFSFDSTMFVSCSQGKSKIWDADTATLISTIPGHTLAVANDFSTIASSEDNVIMYYNVNGSARNTMITTSSKIEELALSESCRVAAALSDGTVWLWESRNGELIDTFDGFKGNDRSRLKFSPTGTRLAYSSANGIVKLRDGISGRFVADLQCGSSHKLEFSDDGSRLVSVSPDDGLTLWNSESGELIAAVTDVGQHGLAISANGSLLATADANQVKLWSEDRGHLAQIKVLQLDMPHDMAFSLDNVLAIATFSGIKLYNTDTNFFVHTLPFGGSSAALAFSSDCTHLAVGDDSGNMNLWDIRGIDPSKEETSAITALTLSRDCSQLACGFEDGTVELWGTNLAKRRIASHQAHERSIRALGFGPDGRLFASGSDDGTIKLWNGGDGSLRGTSEGPRTLQAVALSSSVLVAAGNGGVTVWSLDPLRLIHTFKEYGDKVSIAEHSALIAVSRDRVVSLLDGVNLTTIATYDVTYTIDTMTFLLDNSQLVVQSREGVFQSLNLVNNHVTEGATLEHLTQLPSIPLWRGVPIWHCQDKEQHYVSALFSQHNGRVPVLWIPKDLRVTTWTQGSSMIALGCKDGRIILVRLPTATNHGS